MSLNRFKLLDFTRFSVLVVGVAISGLALSGCELTENQLKTDRAADMSVQDFRDGLAPRLSLHEKEMEAKKKEEAANIPALQSYVAQPSEDLKPMPLVSISVNQTVPLRDVLFELAKQANFDVELDPRITGSIIFTARDKPFDEVVSRIAEMSGLRYKINDGVLRVQLDTPFSKTYKVDYLSYIRKNTSSIRNDISVVTGSGANTGSGFEAAAESEADFWGELTTNLQQILGVQIATGNLKTESNPQITAVASNPAPVAPAGTGAAAGQQGSDGNAAAPAVNVQAPEATLQVNSLPPAEGNMGNDKGKEADNGAPEASFSVNRQAGIVSVYATERQQKEVAEYLKELKRSVTAQVLIEAKVLEVSLSDEYNTGINWSQIKLAGDLSIEDIALPTQPFLKADTAPNVGALFSIGGDDVNAVIQALSQFGTVRALASPRMTVLNNQSAVLNVAQNLVYFDVDLQTTDTDQGSRFDIDTEIRNVPEGVIINMQPAINLDDRTVALAIRPTITNVEEFQEDPGVALKAAEIGADISSNVPVVQVQEFDSVISMNSGQAVIMGGLMQDRQRSEEQAVPIVSEIPLLGAAFKSHVDRIEKTELIVFLRATIIDGSNVDNTDREIYKKFSGDRHPLDL